MSHLSLSQLGGMIRGALEKQLEATYWVVGEIGELRLHAKGHCYLELVEKEGESIKARLKATIWAYTYENLVPWFERVTGSNLKTGMKVLVNVEVQYHEVYGLGLNVRDIDANFTLGEKQKLKQEVLKRLEQENLLHKNKALALPSVPQRIAVISSPHAAGYQDYINHLKSTPYQFVNTTFTADMQGSEATRSIVEALKNIFERINEFDLVVIIRGGGAQSDLDCFDTYLMGKAVARFPLPVLTGIGHDRDETVADKVARVSLKTPTAVAEFLISGMRDWEHRLDENYHLILNLANGYIDHGIQSLKKFSQGIRHGSIIQVSKNENNLKLVAQKLVATVSHYRSWEENRLREAGQRLRVATLSEIGKAEKQLEGVEKFFNISDPQFTLQRGFSYTTLSGKPLSQVEDLKEEDEIETVTADKHIKSIIKEIE